MLHTGIDFSKLKSENKAFTNPRAVILVNGQDLIVKNPDLAISQLCVDLTSGFEASVASFRIYGIFDRNMGEYKVKDYSKFIAIGSAIEIGMGYREKIKTVFVGVITMVSFVYDDSGLPYIVVTAMDVKALMMANNHSRQLAATTVGAAVKEIFDSDPYSGLVGDKSIIRDVIVGATPDEPALAPGAAPPAPSTEEKPTIEMVGESDYEFVVKMAKKVNFDFFVSTGKVIFRSAKADTANMMTLKPENILRSFDISYDITGQVGKIEVRATDTDKGEQITSSTKISNKWSLGNAAGSLVKNHVMTYLDPSVHTKAEADMRLNYLVENTTFRFGTLNCETLGLAELLPGKFIKVHGLGKELNNRFYVRRVKHIMSKKGEYKCVIEGSAAMIK